MRFIIFMMPNKASYEAGAMPTPEAIDEMTKYNTELVKAGVLLAGDGLQPPAKGAYVTFGGGKTKVTDGPFSESKEVIGGYWIFQTKTREECIEWLKRIPPVDEEQVVVMRQIFEMEDFPPSDAVDRAYALQNNKA